MNSSSPGKEETAQPGFLGNLGLLYRVQGISHAILTTRSTAPVTAAGQLQVFFFPLTHPSGHGPWIACFEGEIWVSGRSNRMGSVMRWQGSEPGGEGDTQVQQKALKPTDADVQGSCTGLLHGAWKRKQLLLIAAFAWALLQTQIFVKPLNIFSHLMLTKTSSGKYFILNLLKNHLKFQDDANKPQAG